ncbi:galactokinase [Occultella gossypii]|uniref:Galactokinase n=1 Tax=Occultella gossypii TaxID=2800820 RepID=A0ABS7SBD3_9MICO|nr:galactokinase [Occultella gossypii]MBZ2197674.1 galactokinase [Occultella gossypii]
MIDPWNPTEGAASARAQFAEVFGGEPDGVWSAPGRVNLIGEHTDYNGGLCLPVALPHRTFVALRTRDDGGLGLVSGRESGAWSSELTAVGPGTVEGWPAYPAGVAWALAQAGVSVPGFDAAVASCVPYGAGLSSSAALESAFAVAIADSVGAAWTGPDPSSDAGRAFLAQACVRAENEVAGAPTGGMDQAASLRCAAGHALLLDCRDGSTRQVPFDLAAAGLDLLVIDTRAEHALVDGQYAQRRATCEAAARALGVPTLREIDPTGLSDALAALGDDVSRRRVRHVVTEIARVTEFVALLDTGRVREVGPLMDASHESLRVDYEVTSAELDVAVATARAAGALGARMTGGGFGGSAIALIEAGTAQPVAEAVSAAFADAGFTAPEFLIATPSGPAHRDI